MRPVSGEHVCTECAAIMRPCGNLDYFPVDKDLRRELINRLHGVSRDHGHAKAIIERWRTTQRAAPKEADLIELAGETRNEADGLSSGCSKCNGAYWVVVNGEARRCECTRGRALRQMDRQRNERREIANAR
jgi:hypothetical protein